MNSPLLCLVCISSLSRLHPIIALPCGSSRSILFFHLHFPPLELIPVPSRSSLPFRSHLSPRMHIYTLPYSSSSSSSVPIPLVSSARSKRLHARTRRLLPERHQHLQRLTLLPILPLPLPNFSPELPSAYAHILKPVYKATLALDPPREVVLGAEVAKLSGELKEMKASYSRAQVLNEKLNIAFSGAGGRYEWMVWQSAGCGKERVGSSRA